jgi:uncharacterized protein YraI
MGTTAPLPLGLGALLLIVSTAAMAQNAMTTEAADLYAGPDNSYPVVAQLDSNTPIQVMGCLDDWSWCDVALEDTRGWLYSPDITYAYQGGYVPLYSYAPSLGIVVVPFAVDAYWDRYYHDRPWYSRREEWAHRTVNHRRPPGPPPSAGPPPRPEHREAPREADRINDRPVHLGRAGTAEAPPAHRDDERKPDDRRWAAPSAPSPPRPETRALPSAPAPTSPHEERSRPQPAGPAAGPQGRASPPTHEERPRPAPPKEEEHPH